MAKQRKRKNSNLDFEVRICLYTERRIEQLDSKHDQSFVRQQRLASGAASLKRTIAFYKGMPRSIDESPQADDLPRLESVASSSSEPEASDDNLRCVKYISVTVETQSRGCLHAHLTSPSRVNDVEELSLCDSKL